MGDGIQTSFIPKQTLSTNVTVASSRGSLGLLMLIGLVVMGLSLVVFAGAYGYRYILLDQINRPCQPNSDQGCGLRESLERDKRELQIERILRFRDVDAKMKAAAGIINNHATVIPIFDELQRQTVQTIRYTKFDYSDKGIDLEGVATSYEDIAVQHKKFEQSDIFTQSSFSGLGLDQRGNITFKLSLVVNRNSLSYARLLQEEERRQTEALQSATSATTTGGFPEALTATTTNSTQ